MKKILIVVMAVAILGGGAVGAAELVSEDVRGQVSLNCESILGQLQNVRYYDRKAREYLGNRYERLVAGYVTNLNVRLVRNNMLDVRLQELQGELVAAHGDFKADYGRYATEMDGLIGMDCRNHPEEFAVQLGRVRELRTKVRADVGRVNEGLFRYRERVVAIKGAL